MRNTLIAVILISCFSLNAQESNLQAYTPSILFGKGDWEFKSFQNIYTQTKAFDADGGKVDTGVGRQTWFTSINQFLYGLNSKINIGADVWVKNANYEQSGIASRTSIVGFGPKIKIAPFNNLKRLSIQSTFLFPLGEELEGRPGENEVFLHNDGSLWLNQIFYDLQLSDQFQLFMQQAFWYQIVDNSFRDNNYLQTQTSLFASYFPNQRWTLYAMSEYFPTHYNDALQKGEGFFSYFVQSGIGTKYQLIPNLVELEFLYTNFWNGSEGQGAGETINFGIRVIRQ